MKKLLSALCLLLLLPVLVNGQQNHVPNGSFEYYTQCPQSRSLITNALGWGNYNNGSVDYVHGCANNNTVGVPQNFAGYQHAAGGVAYMIYGAGYWSSTATREYLARAIQPLQIGLVYEVSISANLTEWSGVATDDIGIHFSENGPTQYSGTTVINVTPQVDYSSYGKLTDTQNWVRMTKYFYADSAYDHIGIGSFKTLANTDTAHTGHGLSNYSFIAVDSVVIRLSDSLFLIFNDSLKCSGDTILVNYTSLKKKQSNNTFTLQLSNASGSFASPVNIGSVTRDTSGTITAVIPANTPTGTGYKLRIVASNYADTSAVSINIKIGNGPIAKPLANNNSPVCANDTLKLSATTTTSGVTWSWTGPNSFASAIQNPQILSPLPANSGNYIVTSRLHGCMAKDTTTVVVSAGTGPAGTTASYNTPLCADDTLKLFGTANGTGNSYSWTGPGSFTSNTQNPILPMATSAMSGDYVLYAGNGNCVSRDTVAVVVKPRPANFSATSNSPVCTGETLNFTGSSTSTGVTYAWTGPGGFNSTSATPFINGATAAQNGDYYVTGTLNGCPLRDTVTVVVKPLPVKPVATVNTPVCAGETLNFTATTSTSGVSWSWTGPGSYSSTSQNPSITGTTTAMSGDYIVSAILNGCAVTDTATALVKPLPVPVTASSNSPVCAGDTLHITIGTSTTGVSYSWAGPNSFSANTQNTFVTGSTTAASGWYVATLNLNGCLHKDSTQATVHPIPATPNISYSNPMCVGETLQLNATTVNNATYNWTGVGNYSSTLQNPTRGNMQFGDTGTYSVTTTINGCTSPAGQVKVYINPVPFVVIFPTPGDSICVGEQASFTALPNNHGGTPAYQWRINGLVAGGNSPSFSSTTLNHGDVVRVDMTENTKCRVNYTDPSNDVTMNVLPWLAPSVSISASPNRPLNVDEYVTFTATTTNAGNFPKYQWKRNGQDVQGATGPVWSANTLNDNDSISVEIISNYRCPQPTNAVSNGIRVKVLTGVGNIAHNRQLKVYPNPAKDYVVFEHPGAKNKGDIYVRIYNAIGQKINEITLINDTTTWNTANLPAGVYVYRLVAGDGVTETGRVIISR
jgi:hypothetical protein